MSFSITSSSTMTLAGTLRPVAGGTSGGDVSTALIGSPCGGPKSPLREPPVSSVVLDAVLAAGGWSSLRHAGNANAIAAIARNIGRATRFIANSPQGGSRPMATDCPAGQGTALIWIKPARQSAPTLEGGLERDR